MVLMSDPFNFKYLLNRRSRSEWSGEGTTRIQEYPIASQILKEYGVPDLHSPVGEQHIDLTWCIGVK
jgi:predicted component of type VI protein secretion system